MTKRVNTFPKKEHLRGDVRISSVMRTGKAFLVYPIKVVYSPDVEDERHAHCQITKIPPVRLMVAAPKRRLRHAVDRNLVKRRLREAYRTAKQPLFEKLLQNNMRLLLIFRFVANEPQDFVSISKSVSKALARLTQIVDTQEFRENMRASQMRMLGSKESQG